MTPALRYNPRNCSFPKLATAPELEKKMNTLYDDITI